jgi:hypothetical protein
MKHKFLIHQLNHTSLLVDITAIGLPTEIYPPEGKPQSVLSLRFQVWLDAEEYLARHGASDVSIQAVKQDLRKTGAAVLTIN